MLEPLAVSQERKMTSVATGSLEHLKHRKSHNQTAAGHSTLQYSKPAYLSPLQKFSGSRNFPARTIEAASAGSQDASEVNYESGRERITIPEIDVALPQIHRRNTHESLEVLSMSSKSETYHRESTPENVLK